MGVASGCGCKGYIDFLIQVLLIPTPLVSLLLYLFFFAAASLLFVLFLFMFFILVLYVMSIILACQN